MNSDWCNPISHTNNDTKQTYFIQKIKKSINVSSPIHSIGSCRLRRFTYASVSLQTKITCVRLLDRECQMGDFIQIFGCGDWDTKTRRFRFCFKCTMRTVKQLYLQWNIFHAYWLINDLTLIQTRQPNQRLLTLRFLGLTLLFLDHLWHSPVNFLAWLVKSIYWLLGVVTLRQLERIVSLLIALHKSLPILTYDSAFEVLGLDWTLIDGLREYTLQAKAIFEGRGSPLW